MSGPMPAGSPKVMARGFVMLARFQRLWELPRAALVACSAIDRGPLVLR
jgi:hypothetical protein